MLGVNKTTSHTLFRSSVGQIAHWFSGTQLCRSLWTSELSPGKLRNKKNLVEKSAENEIIIVDMWNTHLLPKYLSIWKHHWNIVFIQWGASDSKCVY